MSFKNILGILTGRDLQIKVDYNPYSLERIEIYYGLPPIAIKGFSSVMARWNQPQTKLITDLAGRGKFIANKNQSGQIQIGMLQGVLGCGILQALHLSGIAFPLVVIDLNSKGSSFAVGTACRATESPDWAKTRKPGIAIYTFETPRLIISDGIIPPI
jgi:hypothetical protein